MIVRQPLEAAASDHFRRRRLLETIGERFRSAPISPEIRTWLKRAYHSALMAQTRGRGLACRLPGGETVRALPEHRYLSWNPEEYAAFRSVVRVGSTALDIGANVGAYALALGHWVGATGAVFAFEPAPAAFDGLTRHVHLNHLEHVVHPVHAAVAERPGRAGLILSTTAGESRLASADESHTTLPSVPITTIDEFCAAERLTPDFIKIDVEGWELAALRGARQTIRDRGRALALFIELHPSIWPALGLTREDIVSEITAQRLQIVPLTAGADPWTVEGVCVRLIPR
jgi:FkbM family methyltransferase